MTGKIIKGIAGFYYVQCLSGLYECKARGVFRNKKIKPLVGDWVELEVIDEPEKKGNIVAVCDRKNALIRPEVANVDQALVVFALASPEPNFNLLDRFLLTMEAVDIPTIICFNKDDLQCKEEVEDYLLEYQKAGYQVVKMSVEKGDGIQSIRSAIQGKTTVFAGPSGVGKSSLLNCLCNQKHMDTGAISDKIGRGKHTTRHSELFMLDEDTFIMDTPGFTSLMVLSMEPQELKEYYPEFAPYIGECRFNGCVHVNEPNCAVKQALMEGKIGKGRYQNYCSFYEELKNKRKY